MRSPRSLVPILLRENIAFRRFFAGQSASLVGDQISFIALPLVGVIVLHADATQMGYLTAAGLAPNLLLSLHAGAWVDRRGRRRQTMLAAYIGRAALLATIPIAYAFDALTFEQLYVVGFLVGALSVLFSVSYNALFVSLVPREQYVDASSLLNGSRAMSFVAGPSLGGLLVQVLSAPVAIVADALSFAVSALSLSRISPTEAPTAEAEHGHVAAGIRYILATPVIRASLAATTTINFFNFMLFGVVILFANRELGVGPGLLGLVLGAGAVGGVVGSLVTGRIVKRIGVGPALMLGCIVFPTPLLLIPLAAGPRWVVLGCLFLAEFGSGFGVMLLDIAAGAISAAMIPDRLRARVSGAYMVVNYGVRPIGALLGGALGSAIGLRPTLWIAAGGAIAGFVWLIPSPLPRLRELPEVAEG